MSERSEESEKTDETAETDTDVTEKTGTEITSERSEGSEKTNETAETDIDLTEEIAIDITEKTETDTETETTEDVLTTGSYDTSEYGLDALTPETESHLNKEITSGMHLLPEDLLKLEGRHIKAEDFEWGKSPVSPLTNIIVEAAGEIESSDLEQFLRNATHEQKLRILELLPLDMPLHFTIPILEDGIYWKRLCLRSWPAWDVWRYSDSWKFMFVHRTVHELIENFIPDKDSMKDLCKNIEVFSKYVTLLQIRKLIKVTPRKIEVDVISEDFDQELDDTISAHQNPIYLCFENLFNCFPHLKSLTIALSPAYGDFEYFRFNNEDFSCLFKAMKKMEKLEKIRLSNGNFSNEQISKLLEIFLKHKELAELNLSFNFIDEDTCYKITKFMIFKSSLEYLNLKYNKITDKGARVIASALFTTSHLKKLDLSLNMIGDDGACTITKALLKNEFLTELDLSKNKITENGGIAFSELIKKSRTIRSLKIEGNFLGEIAGKHFVEAIKENDYLLELDVRFCGFRNEDEGLIHRSILQNRSKVLYSAYVKNNNDKAASEFLF